MQYFLVQFPRHLIAARSAINTIYAHLPKHLTSSEPQNKFITLRAQTLLDFIAMSNAPQSTHLTGQVHLLLLPLFLSRLESSTTLNPGQHSKLVRDRILFFFAQHLNSFWPLFLRVFCRVHRSGKSLETFPTAQHFPSSYLKSTTHSEAKTFPRKIYSIFRTPHSNGGRKSCLSAAPNNIAINI